MAKSNMAKSATESPTRATEGESRRLAQLQPWRPFENLRHEINRLFDDFDRDFWPAPFRRSIFDLEPFWRRELSWAATPAVDIVEKGEAYEITAELPGLDESDIEVKLSDNGLTILGRKQEEKEEKKKGYHFHERHVGSFERYFRVPDDVNPDKIEAEFKKGVLTVTLPKKAEARKPARRIKVKS